jgi:hypothetical protein
MSLIAKAGESKFDPISEGVHVATCVAVIDLGEQYSTIYDNTQHRVLITFELHDETVTVDGEEKNRFVSKEYTVSLGDKATLRKDLEAWRGKKFTEQELQGFDLKNILGKSCQVQVLHSEKQGKTYANVSSIMSMPKGMQAPPPQSELTLFDFDDIDFEEKLAKLPEWVRTKITASITYKKLIGESEADEMQETNETLPWEKGHDAGK